ncbi:allophanate hydrolase subunit 1 [Luteimicrobium xylanilyticum]|uniref:Kinase A inhibitor n=1 Tax=Luteimicrobium xylanilyticum TaxID=1133546 RepID=A0A5P9QBS8_9MICO|nr:allophanate hydrolase subunit 1 [Luteimicrobium xylanilyticum]QFU98893.1 Kinase A inhibitor [Luteimicrobium xylanilyticum]
MPAEEHGPRVLARPYGSAAVMVDVGGEDPLPRVVALTRALRALADPDVADLVPAARSVLVLLRETPDGAAHPGAQVRLVEAVRSLAPDLAGVAPPDGTGDVVEIPVVYDGPDLDDVAELAGLTTAEVVERHASALYTAAFVGFAPGFAYLVGLDPSLRVPRLATPRPRVDAGAVAVAGEFTAVYPTPSPGGWRLLGRTPARMFDVARTPPGLVVPGARVRFVPERS